MLIRVQDVSDFNKARDRAGWQRWLNKIRQRPNDLLPFEPVQKLLGSYASIELGLRDVPLDQIVGSVGRYREFNRAFWPLNDFTGERWLRVNQLYFRQGFAPITVFKVGEVYFVNDGNHRVSVGRAHGLPTIEAYVTELRTSTPVYRTDTLADISRRRQAAGWPGRSRRLSTGSYAVAKSA